MKHVTYIPNRGGQVAAKTSQWWPLQRKHSLEDKVRVPNILRFSLKNINKQIKQLTLKETDLLLDMQVERITIIAGQGAA